MLVSFSCPNKPMTCHTIVLTYITSTQCLLHLFNHVPCGFINRIVRELHVLVKSIKSLFFSGNICAGNLSKYIPFIMTEIQKNPRRQYLLLHSLKEVNKTYVCMYSVKAKNFEIENLIFVSIYLKTRHCVSI